MMDWTPLVQQLRDVLSPVRPWVLYGFGSWFRDNAREDSDIDVAFFPARPVADWETFDLAQEAAARIGRDVDLINLQSADSVITAQVITAGQLLFCDDPTAKDRFEMRSLANYARLNEERRETLARIAEEGVIYG